MFYHSQIDGSIGTSILSISRKVASVLATRVFLYEVKGQQATHNSWFIKHFLLNFDPDPPESPSHPTPPSPGSIPPWSVLSLGLRCKIMWNNSMRSPFPRSRILAEPQELKEALFGDTFDWGSYSAFCWFTCVQSIFELLGQVAQIIFGLHFRKGNFLKCVALLTSVFFLNSILTWWCPNSRYDSLQLFMVFSFRAVICWTFPGISRSITLASIIPRVDAGHLRATSGFFAFLNGCSRRFWGISPRMLRIWILRV